MALTYADIRQLLIDPQIMKLKEELYGSGISFGTLQPSKLPPSTVVVGGGGGTTDPNTLGFIKGVAVYSGGTLIGSDKKELSFLGAGIAVAGDRATIDIATPLSAKITNPMTAAGDIIYGLTGGVPTRRAIGVNGQYLAVVAGIPQWVSLASGTGGALADPTTTIGDLIYRNSGGITRLGIGASGQLLTSSGGEPIWADPPLTGMQNPMTTLGDLIKGDTGGVPLRLAIGTEGYRLAVSGGIPQWAPNVGFNDPLTTNGDLLYRTGGVTTRLPIGVEGQILTVSGSLPRWEPFVALTNPMTAGGDMIYGQYSSSFLDIAPSGTASQTSTNGSSFASLAIDNDDSTAAGMNGSNSPQALTVDLGSPQAIARFRVLQSAGGFTRADSYSVESSDDNSTWVTRHTYSSSAPTDTGQVSFDTPVTARYWRISTPSSGAFAWDVYTFSLFVGINAGTPTRLPIGADGQFLSISGGIPTWSSVSASGFTNPMTTRGDVIYAESGGAAYRLGIGAPGQVLTVTSGYIPAWVTPSGGSGGSITISGATFTQVIGNGSSTVFDVNHNLGTRDLLVQVRENNAPYEYVYPDIYASGINDTVVTFNTAPVTSGYIVLIGGGSSSSGGNGDTSIQSPPTAGWSWVNQGGASLDTTGPGIFITTPGTSGNSVRIRTRAAPSTPYTITAKIQPSYFQASVQAYGLCFRESSSGKLHTFSIQSAGDNAFPYHVVSKWNDATSYIGEYNSYTGGTLLHTHGPIPLWFRIVDDGTDRICYVSHDGLAFIEWQRIGRTDFLTADEVGFFIRDVSTYTTSARLLSWRES